MACQPLELSPGEWAVLGAVAEGPTHGFAVAQLLAPSGALGQIWTLRRPVVYQVLKKLAHLQLLSERATQRSDRGPRRTIVAATPAGQEALRDWLVAPVDHVRDVRSLLLLKLALLDRSRSDPLALLDAQRRWLLPRLVALEEARDRSTGFERVVAEWRLASSQATLQFLDAVTAPAAN